jgi:hypothetical protein
MAFENAPAIHADLIVYLNSKPVEPGLYTDVDRALGLRLRKFFGRRNARPGSSRVIDNE